MVCALCVILICTLPLWGRASGGARGHQRAAPICVGHIFRRRDVLPLLCGFALYNAMETAAGQWGATFVHDRCGISTSDAALTSTLYFGALTVGRFLPALRQSAGQTGSSSARGWGFPRWGCS